MGAFINIARRLALSGCVLGMRSFAQVPHIASLAPDSVPIAGGIAVSIRGADLAGAKVTIDGAPAAISATAAGEIQFTAPKHDNGYAILRVSTAGGTATTTLLYVPPRLQDLPPGYITTVAGVGNYFGEYGPARNAPTNVGGLSYGPDGSLFLGQASSHTVVRIRPDGILEPFAGSGLSPSADPNSQFSVGDGGPAINIRLVSTREVLAEDNGDVVFTDGDSGGRIWRVEGATGIARTIAGNGRRGFSGDKGSATSALLSDPDHLTGDRKGTVWFIDWGNARIRRITPDGKIDTICGTGTFGYSGDGGPAVQAQFNLDNNDLGSLAYDPAGFLYLADSTNQRLRRIDLSTGIIDTFVGPDHNFGNTLNDLRSVMVGPDGDVYFFAAAEILHVTRTGTLVERFGVKGATAPTFDGTPIAKVRLGLVLSMALDSAGNLVYSDNTTNRVTRLNRATGVVETIAGISPAAIGDGGPAVSAVLKLVSGGPSDLATLPSGEILFGGPRIRRIGLDGSVSVFSGTGTFSGVFENAPAIDTPWGAVGIKTDRQGTVYASTYTHIVRIDPAGFLTRFAGLGNGQCDYSGDGGPARNAGVCQPWGMAPDAGGNVYIADTNNNRVRRVDRAGIISTFAGTGPANGYERYYTRGASCGDGGPAAQACLNTPSDVAVNPEGEVFVAETNHIRKIDTAGVISTLATLQTAPIHIKSDTAGNIYTCEIFSVVRITPSGAIQTLAGNRTPPWKQGFSGDGGPAANAVVDAGSCGITIDNEGNVLFADTGNRRIRAIRFGAVTAPPGSRAETTRGTPQSASIGMPFADPLAVYVADGAGQPAGNIRVDFDAPASGAACTFSNGQTHISVFTGRDGSASAGCTANTAAGAFTVTAVPLGTTLSLKFALTNSAPKLSSDSVVSSASFLPGPIAPGEILTVFGTGVGPPQLAQAAPGANGRFATQFSGVRVRFNGLEAPVLFARFDQVGVIAPYALDGAGSAQVTVEYAGVASNSISVLLAPAAPAIFTADASGRGQGAILNQDNSANSPANPAARGSIVVLFCTGEGQTDPAGVDGKLATDVYPKPKLPVTVTIGGAPAEILYAGAAPTLVAGLLQINARIPAEIAPGSSVPVGLTVGNAAAASTVTVAVR